MRNLVKVFTSLIGGILETYVFYLMLEQQFWRWWKKNTSGCSIVATEFIMVAQSKYEQFDL